MAVDLIKYQGVATQVELPKMRAMTLSGLCTFLDITEETWRSYREKPDFLGVTTRAESIIYQYKFEGAAAGLLNPNIIAREMGLAEKLVDGARAIADVNLYQSENERN